MIELVKASRLHAAVPGLRLMDAAKTWRAIYRIDDDAIVVVEVFEKQRRAMPHRVLADCQRRLRLYDEAAGA